MDMDIQMINGLFNPVNSQQHAQALECLQQMKNSKDAWNICAATLAIGGLGLDDKTKFLCLQVLEHYAKTLYVQASSSDQTLLRQQLSHWMSSLCTANPPEKIFIRNKTAQVFSLIFIVDFIDRWPSFISDILSTLHFGSNAVDLYLKILLAIDAELIDRNCIQTPEEVRGRSLLKDTMRERCVIDMANSWYDIMVKYETSHPELICHCHDIIGAYVSWIDISLIANDRFISLLVIHLQDPLLREASADCVHEIFLKGMEPLAKTQLIEMINSILEQAGVFKQSNDDDSDFLVKLSRLVNCMGVQLILAYQRLPKDDYKNREFIRQVVENKITLLMQFMASEYDDVSANTFDFARDYIQLIKQQTSGSKRVVEGQMENMLHVIILKTKYDDSYNFNAEGEDEAMFDDYRKKLKVVFDNIAALVPHIVLKVCKDYVVTTLNRWQSSPYEDVEAALSLLFNIGEALPGSYNYQWPNTDLKSPVINDMMKLLITSQVCNHSHPAVVLQYFECVTRYEKYFVHEVQCIPCILSPFLNQCGLRNPSMKVRSRCSYLFSRFVRGLKVHLFQYTDQILNEISKLVSDRHIENGQIETTPLLSADDQLFIYEAAALLIVSSNEPTYKKEEQMRSLLSPVLNKIAKLLEKLNRDTSPVQQLAIATCILQASCITARTTKAFSPQNGMKSCNCIDLYLEALQLFISCLNVGKERDVIGSGVRQLMHRLVVCLSGPDLIPILPSASHAMLHTPSLSALSEYLPLINQIISKFKSQVAVFVKDIFSPLVSAIFVSLLEQLDEHEIEEKRLRKVLQRSYYIFLVTIITSDLTEIFLAQDTNILHQVLVSVAQSAVEFADPVGQRYCFIIMKKLVETWTQTDAEQPHFIEFVYSHIIPACFMAPMKDSFDMSDAYTIMTLQEAAVCLRTIYERRGNEMISFLHTSYLPTMSLSAVVINEFCQALVGDFKVFRNFLKLFFERAKS